MTQSAHVTQESPFEQVRMTEDREHARVEREKQALEAGTLQQLRELEEHRHAKEEDARGTKRAELKTFASKEPVALLTAAQKEAAEEADAVERSAQQNTKNVEGELVKQLLDPSVVLG